MTQRIEVSSTNAGLKAEGTWDEICEFFREVESSVENYVNEEDVERLNDWRPREHEDKEEMKEKTAEEASIDKKKVEEKCGDKKEELKEGSKKIAKSVKEAKNGGSAKEELADGAKKVAKAVGSKSVESVRKTEEKIYKKIMLGHNPYYFDSEDLSINLKKEESGKYTIKVNITDEDMRSDVRESLRKGE